ncbi:hypothetical protein N9315_03360 [Alphaproteobacteria bacterium]|nr:hypothetical protein [Alphaproteobacteria bacterium]
MNQLMRLAMVCFLTMTVFTGCAEVTSGTGVTKIVSKDPFHVNVRVLQNKNLTNELDKARQLANFHCSIHGKTAYNQDVDNSFFKTMKFLCVTPEQLKQIYVKQIYGGNAIVATTPTNETVEPTVSHKKKCVDLGFTNPSESFGNCVLKLMEIESVMKSQGPSIPSVASYPNIRQKPTDAEKLEGLQQMLEGMSGVLDGGQKKQNKRKDLGCVNNCLASGSMLSYCNSFCSY